MPDPCQIIAIFRLTTADTSVNIESLEFFTQYSSGKFATSDVIQNTAQSISLSFKNEDKYLLLQEKEQE